MLKKFYWPLLYSRNPWEKNFRPIRIREKIKFSFSIFCHWNRRTSEQWCWQNSIDLCCIHEIREKKFFFHQNFSTNQILRKNQIQFFHFFTIGIDVRVNSDAEKILLTFVVFSRSVRKKFFFISIFGPIKFWGKIKFNSSTSSPLESKEEWTLMLKRFYWPLLWSADRRKKIFFMKIFEPIRIREKIQFNYFTFSPLESKD